MKKLLYVLLVSFFLLGCNSTTEQTYATNSTYDVVDYEIVYNHVIARIEVRRNIIEVDMFGPDKITCHHEDSCVVRNGFFFFTEEGYNDYREKLLDKECK